MTTFTPGKTYSTRSVGDHNCIFKITVASRTAKTITTTEGKTLRIKVYKDVEQVKPEGSYSTSRRHTSYLGLTTVGTTIIGADDPEPDVTQKELDSLIKRVNADNRRYGEAYGQLCDARVQIMLLRQTSRAGINNSRSQLVKKTRSLREAVRGLTKMLGAMRLWRYRGRIPPGTATLMDHFEWWVAEYSKEQNK